MELLKQWTCPECDHINVDDFAYTVFPMCEKCGISFEWTDIYDSYKSIPADDDLPLDHLVDGWGDYRDS